MFIILTPEQAEQVKCQTLNPVKNGTKYILGLEVLDDETHPLEIRELLATLPQKEITFSEGDA